MAACLALASVTLVAGTTSGCGNGCADSSLDTPSARFDDDGALVFEVRLTSDGDPVEGATIGFYSLTRGEQGEGGHNIGSAETDEDGVARLVREQGLQDMAVPGQEVTGYQAAYAGLSTDDGDSYCEAREDGTVETP